MSKEEIITSIEFLNENSEVLNVNKFGPVQNSKIIIAVQIHNRIEYLRHLIDTLEKAKNIEDSLLIFSHDFASIEINKLIRDIKFCRVMQIFYPYNIQLFPNIYPGQDPEDFQGYKVKTDKTYCRAKRIRCKNWQYPDKYGHYRVAKITQIKHHWWWKINYVFDGIAKRYRLDQLWVIFLEEDHYVSPDFLYVLKKFVIYSLISLGSHLKTFNNYENEVSKLGVHPWFSSKHNMGMAINSVTWQLIKNCSLLFCSYDDYNWDWSLLHVSTSCLPKWLQVIITKAPRVLHVGDCGVHTHQCAVHNAAQQVNLFSRVSESLFPNSVFVSETSRRTLKPSKENGGWGDKRDHELCYNNTLTDPLHQLSDHSAHFALNMVDNITSRFLFPT
ncbi:unnamed protein product [Dracunculus medinensis]|uniref:Alpha-1,6-mannosyl-glycoprotein 2-beta-N-acetylglucosaminyltransferase n=1 Tax=Dracunculus medinensis TaxID=318479 RepID=A0A3P7PSP0_DRAME|nr:unnamed protein product [Dracunculus medinensis]